MALWLLIPCVLCYAKSLQSCPTLCDPIDSSPPGSPVPGILQARTLEWAAISFSNAWKWKNKDILLFYFRNLFTGLFIKFVYFILYFINMFDCLLLFFFFLQQVWRSRCLLWPGGRRRPRFLVFFAWDGSEDWCLGAMVGKKKKRRTLPGEERGTGSSENSDFFIFILKYLVFFWNIN